MYPDDNQQNKRSLGKRLFLVFLIVAVAVGLAATAALVVPKLTGRSSQEASQITKLAKAGGTLTESDLAQYNKTNLFYGVFKNAAMQQVVHTKTAIYYSSRPHDYTKEDTAYDTYLDYKTKRFSLDSDQYTEAAKAPDKRRCIDNTEYTFLQSFDTDWQKSDSSADCSLKAVGNYFANDGINTGGLTSKQADTFIKGLRKRNGFIKVNSLTLASHQNKKYIMFDVTVTPIKLSDGKYWGLQNFMWAFKGTGLNPATHPYAYAGAGGDGLHFHYYVDPGTQLPVYGQFNTTNILDDKGKPTVTEFYDYRHVEYGFGGTVPTLNLSSHSAIPFDWQSDKL